MRYLNTRVVHQFLALCFLLIPATLFAKSPTLIDPCQLITQAEAEEVMGEKMKAGQAREQKAIGQKFCLYEAVDDNSFAMLQVGILRGQQAKGIYTSIKDNFPDHETVDGVGSDAFIATPGIHILQNDYYLSIAAGNLNRNRDKVLVAGKKAVANLEAASK